MLSFFRRRALLAALVPVLPLVLAACASVPPGAEVGHSPWAARSTGPGALGEGWRHLPFPSKAATAYVPVRERGREALRATALSSASAMRKRVDIPADALGTLHFSWLVPALIERADMALRDRDDAVVRIVLAFDGDRSRFSARDAALSELSLALTGEPLPYATLMYVWSNRRPVGTVIHNPRTDRIRKIIVESGSANLDRWLDYERDVRADFERAFGEAPGPLRSVAIMSDSDNTRESVRAWYGPIHWASKP